MDAVSTLLFVVTAAALIFLAMRNLSWNAAREEARFRAIVSRGLGTAMAESGIGNVLSGGLLAFASRSVAYSISWQVLGLAIVISGAVLFAVARFRAPATPTLEQMPAGAVLKKRVQGRRISGALYAAGALAWLWSGAAVML